MKRVLLRFVCASLVTMMCMGLASCDSFWNTPDNPVNPDDNSGKEDIENIELTPEQVAETMEQLKAAQKEGAQITIAYAYKGVDYEATFERQGDGYAACTPSGGQADWGAWLGAMNGAKVSLKIANNGDGTADIKAVMHGTNGVDYIQDYIGINTIDPENFSFRFTVDSSYLVFE